MQDTSKNKNVAKLTAETSNFTFISGSKTFTKKFQALLALFENCGQMVIEKFYKLCISKIEKDCSDSKLGVLAFHNILFGLANELTTSPNHYLPTEFFLSEKMSDLSFNIFFICAMRSLETVQNDMY